MRVLPSHLRWLQQTRIAATFIPNYLRYRHRYKYPVVYIAACPKTGSTWLAHLLAEVLPGFAYFYPTRHLIGAAGQDYDVTPDVVRELRGKLAIVRSHTPPSDTNVAALQQAFGRTVALVRDPRDVIVSAYHHIRRHPTSALVATARPRALPWTPVPSEVLTLDKEACLDALIESVLPGFVSLSQGWYEQSRTNPAVLLVRYEDLVADPVGEVERVLRFYEIDRPRPATRVAVDATQARSGALKFRRGRAGGWRDELSPAQADRSTRISQPFLAAAGYL